MPNRSKSRRRSRRAHALTRLSIGELTAELDRRRNMLGDLIAQRGELADQIAALDSQIAELQALNGNVKSSHRGRVKTARRSRARNKQSLAEALQHVLRGKTMNVAQMAEAVQKAGYKSTSKSFNTVIGLALLKNKKLFKRVSRGQYTAA